MKRAVCLIRNALVYRREIFVSGLRKAGFSVQDHLPGRPSPEDVLVIWNRYGHSNDEATRFERAGARVVVCENGYLGKAWHGDTWIAMALSHHAGAGKWNEGGSERWDALGVPLLPFRTVGSELVILAQRGIGEEGVASPPQWADQVQRKYGGRIRKHPTNANVIELEEDLVNAASVITWNSAAGLRSLMLGVPVWYGFKHWIGAQAAKALDLYGKEPPNRDENVRLKMFRRLAWAQWRLEKEIGTGEAFSCLLEPVIEAA
jgi:hypothetical protein